MAETGPAGGGTQLLPCTSGLSDAGAGGTDAETGLGRPRESPRFLDPGAAPAEALAPPCSLYDLYDLYGFFADGRFISPARPENGGDTIILSRIKMLGQPRDTRSGVPPYGRAWNWNDPANWETYG